MAKKLYVGNLSYNTNDDTVRHAFSMFGEVASCNVIIDRYTNSSKGFAFVEMATDEAAFTAISGMNGQNLDGRAIRVSEANERPREDRGGQRARW